MRMEKRKKAQVKYLRETDFYVQMKETVEPYLKRYRRRGVFTSFDGTRIFYHMYVRRNAKGNVVISHGFCEFAEKYNELIYYFLQAGYSVFLAEHRGHGSSERKLRNLEKVYVASFEEYVYDLHIFVKMVRSRFPNEMLLFGHSMGGAIGALYLEKYTGDFKKAVLSSPMIQMRIGGVPYGVAMKLARICTVCGLGRTYAAGQGGFRFDSKFEKSSSLSRERHRYIFEKRCKNMRNRTSGATCGWVAAAGKASAYVQDDRNIRKIRIPVLVLAAGREYMVDTDEMCRFAGKLRCARFVWVLNAKHEIFNAGERERLQFYDETFAFLDSGIGVRPCQER